MKHFALALAVAGLLAFFTTNSAIAKDTAASTAKVSPVSNDVHIHYQVLYYRGHHWYVYGTYSYHSEAESAAHYLQDHGYYTRVRAI